MARRIIIAVVTVLLLVIIGGVAGGYYYYTDSHKPADVDAETVEFEVTAGSTLDSVTKELEQKKLIKSALVAKMIGQQKGLHEVKAGNFNISAAMTPEEILMTLNDSSKIIVNTYTLQFLDGMWAVDYARVIAEKTNYSANEILAYWNDEKLVKQLISNYQVLTDDILNPEVNVYLEGYFSPNTYEFYHDATLEDITNTLLRPTEQFYLDHKSLFDTNELSIHEIFTLASMVQFEASHLEDQELVASVFLNRLAIGQRLESSVTVCYALYDKSDWTKCETNHKFPSPYNTYVVDGLPIGPVSNPIQHALMTVLQPVESDYYYFIADIFGDGKVYFAKTFDEHVQLVQKYLEGKY